MKLKEFLTQLTLTILACLASYSALEFLMPQLDYWVVNICAIIIFSLISVGMYFFTNMAATSSAHKSFFSVVVVNMFVKIFLSFILIILFVKFKEPTDKFYLLPFMSVYLIFTIFETIFLSKQARIK